MVRKGAFGTEDRIPLARRRDDLQIGRATMRQLWVAAGASTDAVDIVLAKVPLGAFIIRSAAARTGRNAHLRQGEARELVF